MTRVSFELSTKLCLFDEDLGRLQTDKFVLTIYFAIYNLSKCYTANVKFLVFAQTCILIPVPSGHCVRRVHVPYLDKAELLLASRFCEHIGVNNFDRSV